MRIWIVAAAAEATAHNLLFVRGPFFPRPLLTQPMKVFSQSSSFPFSCTVIKKFHCCRRNPLSNCDLFVTAVTLPSPDQINIRPACLPARLPPHPFAVAAAETDAHFTAYCLLERAARMHNSCLQRASGGGGGAMVDSSSKCVTLPCPAHESKLTLYV